MCLCFNFMESQTEKLKTLKFEGYELKYPETWIHKNFYGFILLVPREMEAAQKKGVQIKVYPNYLGSKLTGKSFKDYLVEHAETKRTHEINTKYEISISDNKKFQYKIEYHYNLDFNEDNYKKVEYIKLEKSTLKYYSFMAKVELFDKYYYDAMLIINSIEKR